MYDSNSHTWEYDSSEWAPISLIDPEGDGNPVARSSHSLAYDIARGVVVLFAGTDNAERLSDTWEYDGLSWKEIVPLTPKGTVTL